MWSPMWQLLKWIQILMIESFLAERWQDEIDKHIGKGTWVQKNMGFGAKERFESVFCCFLPERPWERNWNSTGSSFFTSTTSMIFPIPWVLCELNETQNVEYLAESMENYGHSPGVHSFSVLPSDVSVQDSRGVILLERKRLPHSEKVL